MPQYLKKISETYYYWRRIPLDVAEHHHGTHIKLSLKTKERKEAKFLATGYSAWLNRYISIIRSQCFTADEIERIKQSSPLPLPPSIVSNAKINVTKDRVQELYDLYEHEHIRANRWAQKTVIDQRQMIRIFIELLGGNIEIQEMKRAQLLHIRETVCRFPPNLTKDKRFRGKPLSEILKMTDYEPMSHTRAHRIIKHLKAFLSWCYKHGYLQEDIASSLSMPKKRESKACDERSIYTDEDLKSMFATDVFTGKDYLDRPENFFLPLIGMFTGMRLNEIAQLHTDDVLDADGIFCININNDGTKVLKNATSNRIVPVHPSLIKIGFLDYVSAVRAKGFPRLWMCLEQREDNYGKKFSAFFQRLNRKYITEDPRKVFHSFRHGFASQLKEKGARAEIIAELLGHSHGSITLDRYGKPFSIKTLYDSMRMLDFPLPMKQLQQTATKIIKSLIKSSA